jgi:hypothetical protein
LGANSLKTYTLKLYATPTVGAPEVGELYVNVNENGLPEFRVSADSSVTIGAEMYTVAVNKTGVQIADGKSVYIDTAQGNRPTLGLAKADALATSRVVGMATHNIADNAEGFVTIFGNVHGFNTSGFAAGDILYVSAATAGEVTNVPPSSPHYIVVLGRAMNSTVNGLVCIHPDRPIANNDALGSDIIAPTQRSVKSYADTKTPLTQNVLTKEPTGFDIPDNVVINYDPTTQKVTLTGTPWAAYYQGTLVAALTNGYVSTAHTNTTGHTYFYYYGDSGFAWSTDAFPGYGNMLIAKVVYQTTAKYAARECHGLMQWQVHQAEHNTIGTYVSAGGTIPSASYVLSSTTAGDRRPNVDQTTMRDEDCPTVNAALTSKAYCQVSLTGTGTTAYAVDQAEILALLANNPYYNSFSTPNWGQTLFPSNSVGTVWVYAQPATADAGSQKYRYLFVQPQWVTLAAGSSSGQLATALTTELARNPSELNLGTLRTEQPELVCIGRIALTYTGANWSLRSVLAVTGTKYQQIAVPAGGFLSTVVTDATLTGGGTVADPLAVVQNYLTPGGVQSVTGAKTFDSSAAKVKGSSTGITSIASANASATNYVATLPAATGTIAYTSDIPAA